MGVNFNYQLKNIVTVLLTCCVVEYRVYDGSTYGLKNSKMLTQSKIILSMITRAITIAPRASDSTPLLGPPALSRP